MGVAALEAGRLSYSRPGQDTMALDCVDSCGPSLPKDDPPEGDDPCTMSF
jgi:hypothetical protein